MTNYDAEKFAQVIAALAVATRGEIDDPTIELYFRALMDVPMNLLEAAAVELARDVVFFPRPAEWRVAVDRILDRQERLQLPAPEEQLRLEGQIGGGAAWRCEDCDNTGFVASDKNGACGAPDRCDLAGRGVQHAHRCEHAFCVQRRQQAAAAKRRYAKREG